MKSDRRELLRRGLLSTSALLAFSRLAEGAGERCAQLRTPPQPEGPFYPVVDQVDTDADLIKVNGAKQIAKGQIVLVEGIVTDQNCNAVAGVLVEIWQACETGKYNHPFDPNEAELDPNFQYWGKAITDEKGQYRFRTIIPGAYQADVDWMRPPHIHFKISKRDYMDLITQMYFAGDKLNSIDKILSRLPKIEQQKLIVPFTKRPDLPHPVGVFHIQIEKV